MVKPDWCPQEVWEQARYYWRKDGCSTPTPNTYARAILDAKREAYEDAAKVAEHAGNTWSGTRDAEQACQEAAVDTKCEEIAKAIRAKAEGMEND